MAILPGTRLGPYEITSAIGAGGMGEVYSARDTRLNRNVALKVLPDVFAHDTERMARFEREAKLLASLNHPNIASIYGLEESASTRALVMELVEGPTLAERIAAGPIPVDEALPIAKQVAEALEYAHDHGVIHRDLKPANIKVKSDGTVKVLDFGLAKAMSEDPTEGDMSNSPTLSMAATRQGVILGTAAYMSPEQARGKTVDKRTDIWAYGCLVYEMLTGKQLFGGATVSDTLAAVLRAEPDWNALPAAMPARLRSVLIRCLRKDPRERLRDAGDARLELAEGEEPAVTTPAPRAPWRRILLWVAGGALGAVLVGAVVAVLIHASSDATVRVNRLTVTLPSDHTLAGRQPLALSPDGSQLVYAATSGSQPLLYLRPLNRFEARPIPGTEGADMPFFSPDGQWVGFFAGGKLKKVSLTGGLPLSLADAPSPWGAAWGPDGRIVYSPTLNSGLWRVSEDGGTPERLTQPDFGAAGYAHVDPQYLPDGRTIMFSIWGPNSVAVLSLDTMNWRPVLKKAEGTFYAPSGHLLFNQTVSRGTQLAVTRFDPASRSVQGGIQNLPEHIFLQPGAGRLAFAASRSGTFAFVPAAPKEQLVWVDREGRSRPLNLPRDHYYAPRLSPNGDRVTVVIGGGLRVLDVREGTPTTIPTVASSQLPIWVPGDAGRIAFASNRAGRWDIYTQRVDSSGEAEPLLTRKFDQFPESWSPDGRFLAYREVHPVSSYDIWILPAEGGEPRPFVVTPFNDRFVQFSPNGKWVAYVSDQSGRDQVYVCAFQDCDQRQTVSLEGGSEPRWSRDGRELFFRNGHSMWVVEILDRVTMRLGSRRQLFDGLSYQLPGLYLPSYDVHPDGQRFLMITDTSQHEIRIIQNWFEELKQRVPTGTK